MKKLVVLFILVLFVSPINAQSIKDIFNSQTVKDIVTDVTGGKQLSVDAIKGTWVYISPSVQLKGDNALKNIAGTVATSELENKLSEYCSMVGIEEGVFNYVFNADNTFTCQLKKNALKGSYDINSESGTLDMQYTLAGKGIMTLTANVIVTNDQLTLLFNADKLLEFLDKVSSVTSISAIQTINKLASQYDGVMLGFELQKQK